MGLATPKSNQIKQELEKQKHIENYNFALEFNNFKTAAIEALAVSKIDNSFIKKAEECAENLYHTQKRYFDAAEIYKSISEFYLSLGNKEKYKENMHFAAKCYIDSGENADINTRKINRYNSALEIYQETGDTALINAIKNKIKKIK
jgi:hypothetical protein